jgi:hypothetical protein
MKNIDTFNLLSMPPATALKKISGGRLSGKSDINPQWRYRAMTEQFGLCGIGWKYTVDKQWTESTATGEVMAFVNVSVYIKDDNIWSDAIPGNGGSMLVANEKSGPYNSDEAFKMATTDALSVALKMIGVASAIYEGKWDGSKYSVEEHGATEIPSNELMDTIASIETAPDMQMLQAAFTDAWTKYKGNKNAEKIITSTKDARKKELAK